MKALSALPLVALFTLAASTSHAVLNVCELRDLPIREAAFHPGAVAEYKAKLENECRLYRKYVEVRRQANQIYQIQLDQITVYQALRYVVHTDYDRSKYYNIPVELTYQIHDTDYQLPDAQKSSVIWDNWMVGIQQLARYQRNTLNGELFTFEQLQRIHQGFYTLSDEVGDHSHVPYPGSIVAPSDFDRPWWKFSSPEAKEKSQFIVDQLNENFRSMGLLPQLDERKNPYINYPINIKPHDGGYAIYSGESRALPAHVKNILNFMNKMISRGLDNQHMVWNERLMTPGELAFFTQQYFIVVHPFYEGNGRTSRFLQELIMTTFDLPYGSSGDLMDVDVDSLNHADYYRKAIDSATALIDRTNVCIQSYAAATQNGRTRLSDVAPAGLDYDCRLLR